MRLLLAGSTGLVGQSLLVQALADERIDVVIAPTRRALEPRPRLVNVDWRDLDLPENEALWRVDGAICALGTTRRKAGSAEAFRAIDHDFVLTMASRLRLAGVRHFGLVSAAGADARSPFLYPRTKGDVEQAIRKLEFASLAIARPGFLDGHRSEKRPVERAMLALFRALGPVLPASARVSPVAVVARLLLEAAVQAEDGERTFHAADIARAAG